MACPRNCSVGTSLEQDHIEGIGFLALTGDISWAEAERRLAPQGISRQSLKKHMEAHVVAAELAAAQAAEADELDRLILEARAELVEQFSMAPPDIKPLILVAIRNLDGLKNSKPSQETLIRSLKTITEMTGMKNEQRLMLEYARAQRTRPAPLKVAAEPKELEAPSE